MRLPPFGLSAAQNKGRATVGVAARGVPESVLKASDDAGPRVRHCAPVAEGKREAARRLLVILQPRYSLDPAMDATGESVYPIHAIRLPQAPRTLTPKLVTRGTRRRLPVTNYYESDYSARASYGRIVQEELSHENSSSGRLYSFCALVRSTCAYLRLRGPQRRITLAQCELSRPHARGTHTHACGTHNGHHRS